ncbi:MAG: hypothetical protein Hyperionvirus16_16 [Hyperionvirus sp.]|uniref:Uncharacterized protein n=1 Tax=Hyperionvirus sp. TaxID=2487770 RepID=A0A3G5ACQ6_9VIRU|nr:MAG: hypothetical protein Hyperionvirus16_16 [Hyperionvirus sp.]
MTLKLIGVYILNWWSSYRLEDIDIKATPLYATKCLICQQHKFLTEIPKKQSSHIKHVKESEVFGMTENHLEYLNIKENIVSIRKLFFNSGYFGQGGIIVPTIHTKLSKCNCANSLPKKHTITMKKLNRFVRDHKSTPGKYDARELLMNAIRTQTENILESPVIQTILQTVWDELFLSKDFDEKKYHRFGYDVIKPLEDELKLLSGEVRKALPDGFRDLSSCIIDYSSEIKVFIEAINQIHRDAETIGPIIKMFLKKM